MFISALLKKDSLSRDIIINSGHIFIFPEYIFHEIYKHKEYLLNKSGYSEVEFIQATSSLLRHMKIARHFEICYYLNEAYKIIGKVDPDDTIFISAALAFNCPIWSDDKHFLKQNVIKILTTKEMIELNKI